MLGIYTDNTLRNVNQYRFLLAGVREEVYGFKPRLVLEDGRLASTGMPGGDVAVLRKAIEEDLR